MIVLVPAYEPDARLAGLVDALALAAPGVEVVVVDDGSGESHDSAFALARLAGATVLRRPTNQGKGVALKAGFGWIARNRPGHAVVCADCDGQHSPADILAVARQVTGERLCVLGVRLFTGPVPLRSRLGNQATRLLHRAVTGCSLVDTQTGLRGYPAGLLGWLGSVPGERFEYEQNLLLQAPVAGVELVQVPIETIYLAGNESSHFRPVADSMRIYRPLLAHGLRRFGHTLRFAASSLLGFVVDGALLLALQPLLGSLLAAVILARLVSASLNFTLNRGWVFGARREAVRLALARYAALASVLLAANYLLIVALSGAGLALWLAKLLTEVSLLLASHAAQRLWVFARNDKSRRDHQIATAPRQAIRPGDSVQQGLTSAGPGVQRRP